MEGQPNFAIDDFTEKRLLKDETWAMFLFFNVLDTYQNRKPFFVNNLLKLGDYYASGFLKVKFIRTTGECFHELISNAVVLANPQQVLHC